MAKLAFGSIVIGGIRVILMTRIVVHARIPVVLIALSIAAIGIGVVVGRTISISAIRIIAISEMPVVVGTMTRIGSISI